MEYSEILGALLCLALFGIAFVVSAFWQVLEDEKKKRAEEEARRKAEEEARIRAEIEKQEEAYRRLYAMNQILSR